jgi:hypothetical protein
MERSVYSLAEIFSDKNVIMEMSQITNWMRELGNQNVDATSVHLCVLLLLYPVTAT